MSLGKLLKDIKRTDLYVTPTISPWLIANTDLVLTPEMAQWVADQLKTPPRDRSGSLSASAAGSCHRAQALTYLGYEALPTAEIGLSTIFIDGRWRHLRWQAMLMQLGVLTKVEHYAIVPRLRIVGHLDGLHWEERIGFELKGMNTHIYRRQVDSGEMMHKHRLQVATYFILVPHLQRFSVVYEDKNTHDWNEWVIHREEETQLIEEAQAELDQLNEHIAKAQLPEVLSECEKVPNQKCPYRSECHRARFGSPPSPDTTGRVEINQGRARRTRRVRRRPAR